MKRAHCGFTLFETVLTVGLSVLLIGALAGVFNSFDVLSGYGSAFSGATDTVRTVISSVRDATLSADQVETSHTFLNGLSYSSSATVLVLEMPAVDSTGSVISGSYDYVAFYGSGTTAYALIDTANGSARHAGLRTLGTNVISLAFSYNPGVSNATAVTVTVVASTTSHGASAAEQASETMRLRNR